MLEILCLLLVASLSGNAWLGFLLSQKPKPQKQQTGDYDVQCLLKDLATGPALVKIEYLDRADVLLRSPRHG